MPALALDRAFELPAAPALSGLQSLVRYRNQPLRRFEDARALSPRASAFEFLGTYHLILFDPELIEAVLVDAHSSFSKDAFIRDLGAILGNGLLNSEGSHWRRQRKLAAPSFQRSEIAAYAEQMVESTRRFLGELTPGRACDVHAAFMHLTLDILVRTLFGTEISRAREVEMALDGVMREYTPARVSLRIGLPPWLTWSSRRRIANLRRALDSVLLELIGERRQRGANGSDLLSRLLQANDGSGGLSDDELRDETMTLFLAGHETTALALTYAFRLLALHPTAADRARREVRRVLGQRLPNFDDLPALSFTRAVLDETLRLFPPAWLVARQALRDTQIAEYVCKAGSEVFIVPWVTHRDQRFFSEPELFRPERWLGKPELPRGAYLPFGAGPRICIGNHFALTEAMLVLATCLSQGHFELAQGPLLKLAPAVTLRPKGPVQMRFQTD